MPRGIATWKKRRRYTRGIPVVSGSIPWPCRGRFCSGDAPYAHGADTASNRERQKIYQAFNESAGYTAAGISNAKARASYVGHDDWREIVSPLCYVVFVANTNIYPIMSYRRLFILFPFFLYFLRGIIRGKIDLALKKKKKKIKRKTYPCWIFLKYRVLYFLARIASYVSWNYVSWSSTDSTDDRYSVLILPMIGTVYWFYRLVGSFHFFPLSSVFDRSPGTVETGGSHDSRTGRYKKQNEEIRVKSIIWIDINA